MVSPIDKMVQDERMIYPTTGDYTLRDLYDGGIIVIVPADESWTTVLLDAKVQETFAVVPAKVMEG